MDYALLSINTLEAQTKIIKMRWRGQGGHGEESLLVLTGAVRNVLLYQRQSTGMNTSWQQIWPVAHRKLRAAQHMPVLQESCPISTLDGPSGAPCVTPCSVFSCATLFIPSSWFSCALSGYSLQMNMHSPTVLCSADHSLVCPTFLLFLLLFGNCLLS